MEEEKVIQQQLQSYNCNNTNNEKYKYSILLTNKIFVLYIIWNYGKGVLTIMS